MLDGVVRKSALALAALVVFSLLCAQVAYATDVSGEDSASYVAGQADKLTVIASGKSKKPVTKISIRTSAQKTGWGSWSEVAAGQGVKSGAKNAKLHLRSIQLKVNSGLAGSIHYQVLRSGIGWQSVKADGKIAGSSKGKRWIKGVRVSLSGKLSAQYDVKYRVLAVSGEWQPWKKNGKFSGFKNGGSVSSIQVKLAKKAKPTKEGVGLVGVTYRSTMRGSHAQEYKVNGATSGVVGSSKAMRSFKVWLSKGSYSGSIKYRAYVKNSGWTGWKTNGKTVKGRALSGFKIRLTGSIAKAYDVKYRTCLRGSGWQPWVTNGGVTGPVKSGKVVTAVKVKLVKKNSAARIADGTYVITSAANATKELAASESGMWRADLSTTEAAGKFYVRNERGGVTLQSVATGKFLAAGKTVKLKDWSTSNRLVWRLSWNGGIRLSNKVTGTSLALSGKAVELHRNGTGFFFKSVHMLNDGTFMLQNSARSNAAGIANSSWDAGAAIEVCDFASSGNRVFNLHRKGGNWYTLENVMTKMSITVSGGSGEQGAAVVQQETNGDASQLWKPGLARDGALYFTNRASGKALSAAKGTVGSSVVSSSYKNSPRQSWRLVPASWQLTGDFELDKYIMGIVSSCGGDLWRCFDWMENLHHVQSVDSRLHWGLLGDDVVNSYVEIAKDRGVADCYTDACVFCWLARGCGYSANVRAGGCPSRSAGTVPHGWTEVYVDDTTYVCDPNLRRDLPGYNWYMNTYESAPVSYTL